MLNNPIKIPVADEFLQCISWLMTECFRHWKCNNDFKICYLVTTEKWTYTVQRATGETSSNLYSNSDAYLLTLSGVCQRGSYFSRLLPDFLCNIRVCMLCVELAHSSLGDREGVFIYKSYYRHHQIASNNLFHCQTIIFTKTKLFHDTQ